MFFAVRGTEVHMKCDECQEYVSTANGFWPPNKNTSVECPSCYAIAEWKWETRDPKQAPGPRVVWRARRPLPEEASDE